MLKCKARYFLLLTYTVGRHFILSYCSGERTVITQSPRAVVQLPVLHPGGEGVQLRGSHGQEDHAGCSTA